MSPSPPFPPDDGFQGPADADQPPLVVFTVPNRFHQRMLRQAAVGSTDGRRADDAGSFGERAVATVIGILLLVAAAAAVFLLVDPLGGVDGTSRPATPPAAPEVSERDPTEPHTVQTSTTGSRPSATTASVLEVSTTEVGG